MNPVIEVSDDDDDDILYDDAVVAPIPKVVELETLPEDIPVAEEVNEVVEEHYVDTRRTIFVHNKNCFRCSHLTTVLNGVKIGGRKIPIKPFHNCYWKNGNSNCPAKDIRIEIGVDPRNFVRELLERERANDTEGVAEMMVSLTRLSDDIRQRVNQYRAEAKILEQVNVLRRCGIKGINEELLRKMGYDAGIANEGTDLPEWYCELMQSIVSQQ